MKGLWCCHGENLSGEGQDSFLHAHHPIHLTWYLEEICARQTQWDPHQSSPLPPCSPPPSLSLCSLSQRLAQSEQALASMHAENAKLQGCKQGLAAAEAAAEDAARHAAELSL